MSGWFVIVFVLVTSFLLVAGNKPNNCGVYGHCSTDKTDSKENLNNFGANSNFERKRSQVNQTKNYVKEEISSKRDDTFTDVLKNLLAKVDKAKTAITNLNSVPQRNASSTVKPVTNPVNVSKTTASPGTSTPPTVPTTLSSSSTSGSTTSSPVGSEATTTAAPTVTSSPSPTPTTPAVKPTGNASCSGALGACAGVPVVIPGKNNITIAPGVVLTPNGEIILTPHLPLLPGAGQTPGSKPYPGTFPALLAGLAAATGAAGATGTAPATGSVGATGGVTAVVRPGAPQTSSIAQQSK